MVIEDSKENPTFLAFFKLFLGEVKVESLSIWCHFLVVLGPRPRTPYELGCNFGPDEGSHGDS